MPPVGKVNAILSVRYLYVFHNSEVMNNSVRYAHKAQLVNGEASWYLTPKLFFFNINSNYYRVIGVIDSRNYDFFILYIK